MPQLILAAVANPARGDRARLKQFFDLERGPVARLLEQPPTTRWGSFGLTTLDRAHLVGAEYLEVRSGDRKVIHLYPDGRLVFRASGAGDFLGWPLSEREFVQRPIADPIVVADSIVSFVRFYQRLLPHFVYEPGTVRFRVELRDAFFDNSQLRLYPGRSRDVRRIDGVPGNIASETNPADHLYASVAEVRNTPDIVAFRMVEMFYRFFQLEAEDIPYVRGEGESRAIDVEAFQVV